MQSGDRLTSGVEGHRRSSSPPGVCRRLELVSAARWSSDCWPSERPDRPSCCPPDTHTHTHTHHPCSSNTVTLFFTLLNDVCGKLTAFLPAAAGFFLIREGSSVREGYELWWFQLYVCVWGVRVTWWRWWWWWRRRAEMLHAGTLLTGTCAHQTQQCPDRADNTLYPVHKQLTVIPLLFLSWTESCAALVFSWCPSFSMGSWTHTFNTCIHEVSFTHTHTHTKKHPVYCVRVWLSYSSTAEKLRSSEWLLGCC